MARLLAVIGPTVSPPDCQLDWNGCPRRSLFLSNASQEPAMTDLPIDPAATPEDPDAPQIAADDAGASGLAERIGRHAENHIDLADVAEEEEGLDGEGV